MSKRKNSGKSIKIVATVFLIIGLVASVIVAIGSIVVGIFIGGSYGTRVAVIGVICAIVFALLSWAATRTTYGFGEVVGFMAELTSYAELMTKQNGIKTEKVPSFPQTPTPVITPVPTPTPQVRQAASSEVVCPKCGKSQPAGLNYCRYCGQSMKD